MKAQLIVSASVILFAWTASCKKVTTDKVSRVVKVSFPSVKVLGDSVISLPVGNSYLEQGATLVDDISGKQSIIQPTTGKVDNNVAGFYPLAYLGTNANGYTATAVRAVGVTSVVDPTDYTGVYLRNRVQCVITSPANGVFKIQNPGGAATGIGVYIYMVETDPGKFVCPLQPSSVGTFSLINISFNAGTFVWTVQASGYSTAARTFVRD